MKNEVNMAEKRLLHEYHSAFYKLLHIPFDWIGPNRKVNTICSKEHCNPLCVHIVENAEGARLCAELRKKTLDQIQKTRQPVIHQCHAGLYDVVIPIFSDEQYIGSLCFGQFLLKKPDNTELRKIRNNLSFCKFKRGELEEYFEKTRVFTKEEMDGLAQLVQMLGEFICDSYGRIQFLESVNRSDPIHVAELYIQKHYAQPLTINTISRSVGLSKSYFLHKFCEQTGISPLVYLNQYRVEKASELLINTALTISEISDYCGFASPCMFIHHFRKYQRVNPKKYREQQRLNSKIKI